MYTIQTPYANPKPHFGSNFSDNPKLKLANSLFEKLPDELKDFSQGIINVGWGLTNFNDLKSPMGILFLFFEKSTKQKTLDYLLKNQLISQTMSQTGQASYLYQNTPVAFTLVGTPEVF